ncbi:MAG: UvrD-helicase domain-containing protein, partial [Desulfobacterales bacterium]
METSVEPFAMVMKPFQVTEAPLSGRNLIEASAGTGKTYAIEGLFLRLILEKQLSINQILVVTFTEAATAELKERIRNRLLQAKSALPVGSNDVAPEKAAQLIQDALNEFDRAAIFTIHGFCQRILQENTFETGNLFDTELVTNPFEIMQEVTDDFWRKHFYNSEPELISYVIKKVKGPADFLKLLTRGRAGDFRIVPDLEKPQLLGLDPFRSAFRQLKKRWPACRGDIEKLLKSSSLNGNIYGSQNPNRNRSGMTGRDAKILSIVCGMEKLTNDQSIGFPLFKDFQLITYTKLMKSIKKNQVPPSHEFFHVCEEVFERAARLEDEMNQYLIFLKKELFEYVGSELLSRKISRNVQFFDDLITRVQKSLQNKKRSPVANAIRKKYKAALVDEFQDTDSIQNDIFSKIFSFGDSILFMIGDPKQAIYGFRGADIFSYLNAAANADTKYTLIENWRSVPGMITAVNTLFSNVKAPFVFKEISFEKGRSAKTVNRRMKMTEAPLKLWFIESDEDRPINKTDAVQIIAAQVTREISRLITEGKPSFKPEDIAILVRTNRQAQMMKTCLSAERIPSVLLGAENIFDSDEARELEVVLTGIANPENGRFLRAAMVTDMIG